MDKERLMHLCGIYRAIRRRSTPEEALQEMATYLINGAVQLHEDGVHSEERKVVECVTLVTDHFSLVQLRKGAETRRGRFWWTGRLSQPTDYLLFARRYDGYLFWLRTCASLSCSIKHGVALFSQPEWEWFRVSRPDGTIVLDQIGPMVTLAELMQRLSGQ